MAEYRLYGEPNCNIFSFIGSGEVEQSKSLGLVLYQSETALNEFINLLHPEDHFKVGNMSDRIIIDCEMRQNLGNNNSYRADVVVRVYDKKNGNPKLVILIETKRKGVSLQPKMNHYEREIPNTGTGLAKNNHLFFRAPKPNEEPADGKLVRLTKAPRFYKDGSRLAFELIRSAIVRPFLPPIT